MGGVGERDCKSPHQSRLVDMKYELALAKENWRLVLVILQILRHTPVVLANYMGAKSCSNIHVIPHAAGDN